MPASMRNLLAVCESRPVVYGRGMFALVVSSLIPALFIATLAGGSGIVFAIAFVALFAGLGLFGMPRGWWE